MNITKGIYMQLSHTQNKVVQLMNEGWDLSWYDGITVNCQLQKGGCGKGGEIKFISTGTVLALRTKQVIVELPREADQVHHLTRFGLKIL